MILIATSAQNLGSLNFAKNWCPCGAHSSGSGIFSNGAKEQYENSAET